MAEQIGDVAVRLGEQISCPKKQKQPSVSFWRDLDRELKAARTPEEKEAIWQRFEDAQSGKDQTRWQRRASTLDPVKFRPLDRNQRARIVFLAEKLDAKTHERPARRIIRAPPSRRLRRLIGMGCAWLRPLFTASGCHRDEGRVMVVRSRLWRGSNKGLESSPIRLDSLNVERGSGTRLGCSA
jgi:hypothetical protein